MAEQMSSKFIEYITYMLNAAGISSRELSKDLRKSPSYISHLLNGKIKSIDYIIAKKILIIINNKYPFLERYEPGDIKKAINRLLGELGIENDDYLIMDDATEEIKRKQEQLTEDYIQAREEIDKITSVLMDKLILYDDSEPIKVIKKMVGNDKILTLCNYALKSEKDLEVLLAVGEVLYEEWGILGDLAQTTPGFKEELKELLKKYGY